MANELSKYIDKLRQLIENPYDSEEDSSSEDKDIPGQVTDKGDVIFTFKTTQGEQCSQHTLDSEIYQHVLKSENSLLLDVYNSNGIYICEENQMKKYISAYTERTNAYCLIEKLNEKNPTCVQRHLDNIVKQVNTLLDDLLKSHYINDSQFRQMKVKRSKVRMDYLFFLPDVRQKNVIFQPIMVCSLGPTISIARCMSRLLQPIYDQVALSTTFFKETDAVHAIEMYANKGLLLSTTLFATFHIDDLCTILSHEEIMQSLERFLNEYYKIGEYSEGISINTIKQFIHLILQNQIFIFENKIFRQIKGGATESPLTILLMNIYMFYWQEDLVKMMINKNEIFGRCFDQVFLTWNGSKKELQSLLHATVKKQSFSLHLSTSIGKQINYMDAQIGHMKGQLQTKINHDMDTEPRALPYVLGHPRLMYSTLIRASLIRAVLCCSNMIDFYNERHDIEETFRTGGYTWDYIIDHVEQFFREFNAFELKSRLDQSTKYEQLRRRVFEYDQQQMNMKIKQQKDEQLKEKIYITSAVKGETLIELQENFKNNWKYYLDDYKGFENVIVEIIGQPKYPSNTE